MIERNAKRPHFQPGRPAWRLRIRPPSPAGCMEHRCGARRKVALGAAIRLPSGERLAARIRDVSLSGAFIDGLAVRLPLLSHVNLELMLPDAPDAAPCHCGALVMREQDDGAGLLFDDFSPLAMVLLFQALDAGAPQRFQFPGSARQAGELNA